MARLARERVDVDVVDERFMLFGAFLEDDDRRFAGLLPGFLEFLGGDDDRRRSFLGSVENRRHLSGAPYILIFGALAALDCQR